MKGNTLLKAGTVGLLGSLVMFIPMKIGLKTGIAPFEIPPSAAFLKSLNLPAMPLALIGHFLYGAFWSIVFVALFKGSAGLGKGILLSIVLWLVMMLVISPIIGWGVFGAGESPSDPALHLDPGPKYMVVTLVLHLLYGLLVGWLDPKWAAKEEE
ncbi:MAG: hypothetical protein ABEH38_07415 [Flavobacteriales bacterium]